MTKYKLRDEVEVKHGRNGITLDAPGVSHGWIQPDTFEILFEPVPKDDKATEIARLRDEIARLKLSRHEWKKLRAAAEFARTSGLREIDRLRELLESTETQLRRTQEERDYYRRDCERVVRLYYEAVDHQRVESEPTDTESLGPIERWGDADWPWVECIAKGGGYEAKAAKALLGVRDVMGRRIQRLAVNQEALAARIEKLEVPR